MTTGQRPAYAAHPTSVVETPDIGAGTAIGCFCHVSTEVRVGARCVVGDHVGIDKGATLGDRVSVGFCSYVGAGVVLEDEVSVGAHVSFEKPAPALRDGAPEDGRSPTVVRRGASIGSNVTLLRGVSIGANAVIESGSVVTRDIPPNAIVAGNPATITGYVKGSRVLPPLQPQRDAMLASLAVKGVALYKLPVLKDIRGTLSAGEFDRTLPFVAKRYFIVYDVSDHEVRGEHAHRKLHQFLVCVKGSLSVVVDDGSNREEIQLDTPAVGIHVPPMVWATQYKYSRDAVLLVMASDIYDSADYIRDYDEYLAALEQA